MDKKMGLQHTLGAAIRLPQGEYAELVKSISGEAMPQVDALFEIADNLLQQNGKSSKVNGAAACVTRAYVDVTTEAGTYRAKLARFTAKKGSQRQQNDDLMIVFDATPDQEVNTLNPFSLTFRKFGGSYGLVVNNDLDPLVNDAKYVRLAVEIIKSIGDSVASTPGKADVLKAKLGDYLLQLQEKRGRANTMLKPALGWMAFASLLYAHVPFGNEDAKIGPLPLPIFVEALVDLSNAPDHDATGYQFPEGAVVVGIGNEPIAPPVITNYETAGVPSTRYASSLGTQQYNESKPGLYALALPQEIEYSAISSIEEEVINEETGCYELRANTTGDRTLTFTQSPELAELITVTAVDGDTIAVCAKDGIRLDALPQGNLYFYQGE